jgi:hypothetical protein
MQLSSWLLAKRERRPLVSVGFPIHSRTEPDNSPSSSSPFGGSGIVIERSSRSCACAGATIDAEVTNSNVAITIIVGIAFLDVLLLLADFGVVVDNFFFAFSISV